MLNSAVVFSKTLAMLLKLTTTELCITWPLKKLSFSSSGGKLVKATGFLFCNSDCCRNIFEQRLHACAEAGVKVLVKVLVKALVKVLGAAPARTGR